MYPSNVYSLRVCKPLGEKQRANYTMVISNPRLTEAVEICLANMLAIIALFFATSAYGQNLVDSAQELPGVWAGDASWGDYDNDGDLDLALMGEVFEDGQAQRVVRLFGNEEALMFEDLAVSQQIAGVYHGALAWGDYDGDGDLDLAVAGWDVSTAKVSFYKTTLFLAHSNKIAYKLMPAVSRSAWRAMLLSWGDADNDGDIDLLSPV